MDRHFSGRSSHSLTDAPAAPGTRRAATLYRDADMNAIEMEYQRTVLPVLEDEAKKAVGDALFTDIKSAQHYYSVSGWRNHPHSMQSSKLAQMEAQVALAKDNPDALRALLREELVQANEKMFREIDSALAAERNANTVTAEVSKADPTTGIRAIVSSLAASASSLFNLGSTPSQAENDTAALARMSAETITRNADAARKAQSTLVRASTITVTQ